MMEKKKNYIERLGVHGPKLLKNIFLILVGGVAAAINEVPERVTESIKTANWADLADAWVEAEWDEYWNARL